jgi:hypothetical protein
MDAQATQKNMPGDVLLCGRVHALLGVMQGWMLLQGHIYQKAFEKDNRNRIE